MKVPAVTYVLFHANELVRLRELLQKLGEPVESSELRNSILRALATAAQGVQREKN